MLDLLTGRRGRALLAALCLAALAACHEDPATPVPSLADLPGQRPVVDYSAWPLGRLEAALIPPTCAAPVPSQRYFRNLTPEEAADHGFGIIEGYLAITRLGIDAPAPCPFTADESKTSAVNQAVSIFLNEPETKEAYGAYGECLLDQDVEGAANPMEAELLVVKRYSTLLDAGTTGSGPTAGMPSGRVIEHEDELLRFERRVATASARCQAVTIAPVSRRLIAAQRRVLDAAPAEQRPLLEG